MIRVDSTLRSLRQTPSAYLMVNLRPGDTINVYAMINPVTISTRRHSHPGDTINKATLSTNRHYQPGDTINQATLSTRRHYQQGDTINQATLSTKRHYQPGDTINQATLSTKRHFLPGDTINQARLFTRRHYQPSDIISTILNDQRYTRRFYQRINHMVNFTSGDKISTLYLIVHKTTVSIIMMLTGPV